MNLLNVTTSKFKNYILKTLHNLIKHMLPKIYMYFNQYRDDILHQWTALMHDYGKDQI
jgi:hypothetical protein